MFISKAFTTFAVTNIIYMVYFKYLFLNMEDLTPNEGLVYSELLFYSLSANQDYKNGKLVYFDAIEDALETYQQLGWEESILYFSLDIRELMKRTELTFPTVKKILTSLKTKGYVRDNYIRCSASLLQEGYLKIPKGTNVKGKQLIFYAYLLDRAKRYKGIIDTWAYRFKELCGIDADDVYFILQCLKKKGLVERLEDGRLKIYKPQKEKGRNLSVSSPHDKYNF